MTQPLPNASERSASAAPFLYATPSANVFRALREDRSAASCRASAIANRGVLRSFEYTPGIAPGAFRFPGSSRDPIRRRDSRESVHAFADSSMLASFPILLARDRKSVV